MTPFPARATNSSAPRRTIASVSLEGRQEWHCAGEPPLLLQKSASSPRLVLPFNPSVAARSSCQSTSSRVPSKLTTTQQAPDEEPIVLESFANSAGCRSGRFEQLCKSSTTGVSSE